MDDLLSEFLTETMESLSVLDLEIVQLEQNPNNPDLLANIFRLVHTIKGTCGFLGLPRLEKVAHASENVLGKFRDGELEVTPGAVTLILESLDRIKELLAALEEQETEPEGDDSDLITRLNAVADGASADEIAGVSGAGGGAEAPAAVTAPDPAPAADTAPPVDEKPLDMSHLDDSTENDEQLFEPVPASQTAAVADQLAAEAAAGAAAEPEPEPEPEPAPPPARKAEVPAPAAKPPATTNQGEQQKKSGNEPSIASQTIRVSVSLLENLMNMVSELVLTRNQLMQMVRNQHDSDFNGPLQRLSHVTTDLQEAVMKTRMQPIGNAWAKLPRIIRDLSLELGKKIDLQMLGADTELDRQVLELIKDPLTHMVRNSADHGLEMPAARREAGKPEVGKVILNAYHEGGHIIIEIKDDGAGIPVEKLKNKIRNQGMASEAELETMSDQQVLSYIFRPGFSTAEKVTSVSGRGVGMDVVRTNIEKIGGTVDLKSQLGKGTTFTIKIPLTLAIVSALIVECSTERFAIPQISVVELVRVSGESEHRIESINNTPVLRLRNRLLPLVNLRDVLRLNNGTEEENTEEAFIIVTQVGNYKFGIVVDRVFDTEEIVVKPVAPILRDIGMFSGNTILGDGSVIMILDPNGLAAASGEVTLADASAHEEQAAHASKKDDSVALLVFRAGTSEPKAVPLALVARLEEIDIEKVESSNGRHVVQYRGQLMPLIKMDDSYGLKTEGRQPVIVFADSERSMGLVVDEIVDIVDDQMDVELTASKEGFIGSAVIAGKATEIIDAGYYLTTAFGDWFLDKNEGAFGEEAHLARNILLVDDSAFFRNLLTPLLQVAGYQVTTCDNPEQALNLRENHVQFDAIISDIEMPGMNGFEFAEEVRHGDELWREMPMIALSSHATQRDIDRGREAGFTDYVAKFDRDALLATLQQTLSDDGSY